MRLSRNKFEALQKENEELRNRVSNLAGKESRLMEIEGFIQQAFEQIIQDAVDEAVDRAVSNLTIS